MQIDNATHATAVPVAMMHYQYNALKEDALTLGLMQIVNTDQLQDVPNAASPYNTQQLFAVAPKSLYFGTNVARFVFNSNLWYKNVNKTVQKMEINFNNQSGFLPASWNTQVSYTFFEGGVKTIYFRLTYTDGTSYTSRTEVFVQDPTGSLLKASNGFLQPHDSITIDPENGVHSGGLMQIRYSRQNNSNQIRKPLIVAEGFDPFPLVGKFNYDIRNFLNDSIKLGAPSPVNSGNGRILYDDLDLGEYDIVYLDYGKGTDDIWRNARLFKDVIKRVNNLKLQSGSTEQNVVMGMSMGGLVARIALRELELEGYNHQTRKYISVDSPHKGANMPVGFQAAVRHIENIDIRIAIFPLMFFPIFSAGDQDETKGIIKLLNSDAAKQMMIYYLKKNYAYDNSVHNTFQTAYDNLGLPQLCENIAISNGSANGTLSFAPGSAIIDFQVTYDFKMWMDALSFFTLTAIYTNYPKVAWNAIPGHSQVKAEINIDALKNQTVSRVYKGKVYIRKKILWLIPVNITLEDVSVNSEASMLPLDGAPGGMFNIKDFADNLPFSPGDIKQSKFCFIPTGSSLALPNWSAQNVSGIISTSPFHSVFTQNNNELHVDFHSPAGFVCDHLITYISGSSRVCNSATFTLFNGQVSGWSLTQSGSVFFISQNGNTATVTATVNAPYATATLKASINGVEISKYIENCAIKGPSVICYMGSYELNTGEYATWSMQSNAGSFNINTTNPSKNVEVTAVAPSGVTGTLKAVANGKTYYMDITSCKAVVAGPNTICSASSPVTYVLSMGSASSWTASGAVSLVSYNSTSCLVTPVGNEGATGTVTAVFSDGTAISTNVTIACFSGSPVVCNSTDYTFIYGQVSKWALDQTGNVFSYTYSGNTATVTSSASAPYATATLKATCNGKEYILPIKNCGISICGASFLYYGSAFTYSVCSGESATWSTSGSISMVSNNIGSSVSVIATSSSGGTGTLTAVLNNGKTCSINLQSPSVSIDGPGTVCDATPVTFTLNSMNAASSWSIGGPFKINSSTGFSCTVESTANNGSGGAVIAIFPYGAVSKGLTASCAKGGDGGNEVKLDAYVIAFPNPTSGILNIEIDAATHALELQSKSIASVPVYDVRLLDIYAVTRHQTTTQGGTVQFNLSNLPAGVYYLMVHDGISAPLLQQIVVEK